MKLTEKRSGKTLVFFVLAVCVVFTFFLGNVVGTMHIRPRDVLDAVRGGLSGSWATTEAEVVWNIRLPRMILACLVGVNLALSGSILQGVMKNPLADPGIIGISAGAGLFGIAILVLAPQYQALVPPAAFCGAMAAAGIIYGLAWKGGIEPIRIVLSGVAVSTLFSAGISGVLVFFSDRVHGALTFMNGSLSARSWPEVRIILPYTVAGLVLAILFHKKLNILILGDDVARGLGLNVELTRLGFTALAALLAASAVSVVGLLGFVGLIVPHSIRLILGNGDRDLFPGAALMGASLLMLSDTFARTVLSPTEIPVGIVMAVLGVPFFLYLLRR